MDTSKDVLIIGKPSLDPCQPQQAVSGWKAWHADDLAQASVLLEAHAPAVGLIYLDSAALPGLSSLENLALNDTAQWIALVDQEPRGDTVLGRLISHLFFAYHVLPIENEQLDCLLHHALDMARLYRGHADPSVAETRCDDDEIVGATPKIHALFRIIDKVANVDAPLYISGESGTGKELTARAIHKRSARSKGPFVAVNCGAIPSNLIQSELFGYEKGAFTGACQRRAGRIEAAAGGTLFLDEIGDLPLEMQVNLLRFLENRKVQRIGSLDEIPVDVRILSATHNDLDKAVQAGDFREDLYHRLNVVQIDIPPLRERQEDIELLARHYLAKFLDKRSMTVRDFSNEALLVLSQYHWPGNVRELINRIRRAMILCENRLIRPVDLGLERRCNHRRAVSLEQARHVAEHDVICAALARNRNNIQSAARELGVSRVTLYRLIDKHAIHRRCADKELTLPRSVKMLS